MAEKKYFSYDFCIIMIPVKIFLGLRCLFAPLRKIRYIIYGTETLKLTKEKG